MPLRRLLGAACAALLGLALLGATPANKPLRRLVFRFTYGDTNDMTMQSSGIGDSGDAKGAPSTGSGGSGIGDFVARVADRGTIDVTVKSAQPDGSLVVSVAEKARNTRTALPATCIVYSNTTVLCDRTKKVNLEEMELLAYLGQNFVNPVQIDAKGHWGFKESGAHNSMDAGYTIHGHQGSNFFVNMTRTYSQSGLDAYSSNTVGHFTYDAMRTVPTAIVESIVTRRQGRFGKAITDRTEVSYKLIDDSMAPTQP